MRETPKELQIYKHFKGSLYQIVAVAIHTETTDKLVVYRSLTNPERVFARPLDMFLSEVNHKKYPDVKAKYRFTLLEEADELEEETVVKEPEKAEIIDNSSEAASATYEKEAEKTEEAIDNINDDIPVIDPIVEKILDAKDYKDKIENLELIRGRITEEMLTTIAISLDIQFAGDTLEEKYADILKCLKMRNKYETNRFR